MPIRYENKDWDFADLVKHIEKTKPEIDSPGGYVKRIEEQQKGSSISAKLSMIHSKMAKVSTSLSGTIMTARIRIAQSSIETFSVKIPTVQDALEWWKGLKNISKMQHGDDPNRLNDAESLAFVKRTYNGENLTKEDIARIALDYAFRHQDVDTTKLLGYNIHKDSPTWWNGWKVTHRYHMYDPHQIFPNSLEFCSKTYEELTPDEKKIADKIFEDKHSEEHGEMKSAAEGQKKFTGEQLGYVEGPTPKQCLTCSWFIAPNVCNVKNIGMNKPVNPKEGCCNEWKDKLGKTKYGVNTQQPRPQFKCKYYGCGYEGKDFADLMQHITIMQHGEPFLNNKHASIKFLTAKLMETSEDGQYAVYFLLQGDEINGRGWGVTAESIPQNIHTFNNMPFVVTSDEAIRGSPYGRTYDHPSTEHLALLGIMPPGTYDVNDMDLILSFQDRFRVGVMFDPFFKDGTWRVQVKKDEKFKDFPWPPFVSPAIYKLDASEPDGAISKWKGLHLAGLDTRPAYGNVAILHGTCSGSYGHCEHQLKAASMGLNMMKSCEFGEIMQKIKDRNSRLAALNSGDFRNVQILNLDNKKKKGTLTKPNLEGFGNEKFETELRNVI